jgi:hypothetical protein
MGTGVISWGLKLTTYLHLVPRLRMSGAIRLLPLYAFMAWAGTTVLFFWKKAIMVCFKAVPRNWPGTTEGNKGEI